MYKKNVLSLPNGHKWPVQYNNVCELSHNGQKGGLNFAINTLIACGILLH